MFALRNINTKGDLNMDLGSNYTVIRRDVHSEAFKGLIETGTCITSPKIWAYIVSEKLNPSMPLFENEIYYIVSENGNTYEKLMK